MTNIHEAKPQQRLGFLEGEIEVPDNFDDMGAQEIAELFAPFEPITAARNE